MCVWYWHYPFLNNFLSVESTLYNTEKYFTQIHHFCPYSSFTVHLCWRWAILLSSSPFIIFFHPTLCVFTHGRGEKKERRRESHTGEWTHCMMEALCVVHWTLTELIHHNGGIPLNLSLHRHTQITLRWWVWCGWCPPRHREDRWWSPDGADPADGSKGEERMSERKGGNEYRFFFSLWENLFENKKYFLFSVWWSVSHHTTHRNQ